MWPFKKKQLSLTEEQLLVQEFREGYEQLQRIEKALQNSGIYVFLSQLTYDGSYRSVSLRSTKISSIQRNINNTERF